MANHDKQQIKSNLASRASDSMGPRLTGSSANHLMISANSHAGVIRNGGRPGAGLAPKCLIHAFKRMAQGQAAPLEAVQLASVCEQFSILDFETEQINETLKIKEYLSTYKRTKLVHVGGGHDHAYPLLKALSDHYQTSIHVINIDAHLDTRTDHIHHSGTPFRQAMTENEKLRLTQIGVQDFANHKSNWEHIQMQVYRFEDMEVETQGFSKMTEADFDRYLNLKDESINVLSLDLDAISAHDMPAVSAPNSSGLPLAFIRLLLKRYLELTSKQELRVLGLYEFNPIYDDSSGTSARRCAGLIQAFLN